MSIFVESLKRLYSGGKVTLTKLDSLKSDKKITDDEYAYIITH